MATADRMARDAEAKRKKAEEEVAARNPWPAIDARQEALTPFALQPGQDFRNNDPVTNRKIDVNDTTREINRRLREDRYQDAANDADDASMPFQYKAESTWKDDPEAPVMRAKLEILERERANFGKPVEMEFIDQVALARSLAMKNGTLLSAKDIDQYVDWERVNIAADKYVKLYMSGQVNASDNVLKTFFQKEPELAGLLGAAIEIKADESSENSLLMEAAKNPTVVEDAFETAGGHFGKVLTAYFENVTEPVQNYLRASWYQAEQFVGLIPGESAFTAPTLGDAMEITQDDKYNDGYLADMVEKTDYTYFEVEVAKTLHQARVQGKDDVETVQALYEKYGDDMDAVVVMHNMIEAASGNPHYTQLMAQVESAWMGNTGSFLNPFSDPTITEYQEVNNSDILNSANKALTFGSEIVFDPLILGTAPLRAITAARYSLSKLAPGAAGGVGAVALKSQRWHPTNKTQRAFQRFVDDLNKIEDLTGQGNIGAAAEARRRFARQHGMYWSDELIEQVSRLAPRTDGKLTVEGVVKFADNMNEDYLDTMTHYLDEAGDVGLAGSELAQSVQMVMDDLGVTSFDQAIAKAGKGSGQFRASRSPQAPKISALAAARMATSNFIGARLLPVHKQAELLAKYVDATDPVEFSAEFAENAGRIGDDVRSYKSKGALDYVDDLDKPVGQKPVAQAASDLLDTLLPTPATAGRPSGVWDSLGRVPNRVDISKGFDLTSASEATMLFNYARQFLPRHMAAQIRNAWTKGNVASRRNLLVGTVQAAMRSRGINVSKLQAEQIAGVVQRKVATGGKGTPDVDRYGISVNDGTDLPSARLTTSERKRVVETARAKADVADLQARAGVPQTDVLFEVDEFKPLGEDEYLYTLNGQEFVVTGDQYRRFMQYLKKETEVIREPSRTDIELAELDRVGGERVLMDPDHPRYEEAWAELDVAAAQSAWRAGILANPQRVEAMIDDIVGDYKPDETVTDWYNEPTGLSPSTYSSPPTLPSGLGAGGTARDPVAAGRRADEQFIRDGTISQTDLLRITLEFGEDQTNAWLYTGLIDSYLDDIDLPVPPALRRGMEGDPLQGIKALPSEWVEGLGVTTTRTGRKRKSKYDEKLDTEGLTQEQIDEALKLREKKRKQRNKPSSVTRIAVPFAQGGRKGRQGRMTSQQEDELAFYRDQIERDLRNGELDDFMDDYLARESLGTREVAVSNRTPLKDEGVRVEASDSPRRNLGDRVVQRDDGTPGRVASALHVDQTATFVRVPTIADMEYFRRYGDAAYQKMMYGTSRGLQKATDVWSFGTLAGWRFGIRNAVEENMFYFLSGGRLSDWVAGRQLTTTRGRAIPDSYTYEGWSFREKGNSQTPEGRKQNMRYKQNVGAINRWVESTRSWLWAKTGREGTLPDYLDDWADTAGIGGFMRRNVIGPALAPRLGVRGKGTFKGSLDRDRPFVDNEEWEAAVIAMARDKDPQPMYELLLRASVAAKIGPVGLTVAERELFARLATGTAERGLVEEISGLARFMNSGDLPQYLDSVSGLDEVLSPGVTYGQMKERGVRGDSVGVKNGFTTTTTIDKTFHEHWHHQLRWVMEGDGVVGEAAVTAIYRMAQGQISVQEAKLLVRDLLGEMDEQSAWSSSMSNLSRPADLDSFADDYFESVLGLFQSRDSLISMDVLAKFFDEDGTYLGWYKPRVREPSMDDALSPSTFYDERITANDLIRLDNEVKPPRMLVPRVPNTVPIVTDVAGLIDASWKWMGRQNARLSKQNIFWANALRIHRETAAQRARLADIIQENSGVKPGTSIDAPEYVMPRETAEQLAEEMSSKQIAEQAYEATMAYIDNPNVRSNLAWKSRNVSRYYRATEDFWRRSRRAAAQNPELFAKFALIYGLAEDSGFVFKDQYGDKQFMYPGNQFVLQAAGYLTGQGWLPQEMNPYSINGKVLGASPSLEPTSNIPGLTGLANGAAAATFSFLPAGGGETLGQKMPGLQSLVMGRFYTQTGNTAIDAINATLPAHLRFFTDYMSPEQAESSLLSSYFQVLTWSYARGDLDELTVINPDGTITKRQFESADDLEGTVEQEKIRALAHAAVHAKNALRWILPASPQLRMADASSFGRSLGIPNLDAYEQAHREAIRMLDPRFLKILGEARGTDFLDPADYAMDMWMAELADDWDKSEYLTGDYSLSPYSVSTFTSSDESAVANLAMVQPYEDVATWWRQPSNEKWLKNDAFRDAYSFFAPRSVDGEFSQSMWGTFRFVDKLKVKKSETKFIDAVAANEYRYKLGVVSRRSQQRISDLEPFSPTYFDDKKYWEDWARDEKRDLQDEYEGVYSKNNNWINREGDAEKAYSSMNEILSVMRREEGGYENDLAWQFQFVNNEWQTYQSQRLVYSSSKKDDVQKRKELERDFWLGLEDFMGPEHPELDHYINAVIRRMDDVPLWKGEK